MISSSKIILGTANFTQTYGILKTKVEKKNIKSILDYAKRNNIDYLDTATDYGKLSNNLYDNLKKFKVFKKFDLNSNIFQNRFGKNIRKIKEEKFNDLYCYGITLRQPNTLLKIRGKKCFEILSYLRNIGVIKKIGISIYNTKNLRKIIENFKIDYIQLPLNIVNKGVYQSTKKIIKNRKIEIHARSVFLQGLLLKKNDQLPSKLKNLTNDWRKIDAKFRKMNISRYTACLNFVMSQNVDKIIFGVTNSLQLSNILKVKKVRKTIPFFEVKNQKLIDPIYWFKNL